MDLEVGKQIKRLRIEKGVTQEELAKYFGVSYQAISKWENNITSPDIQLLPHIASYFGVTIDELFKISTEENLKRIENAIDETHFISDEKFNSYKSFLLQLIRNEPKNSKAYYVLASLYLKRSECDKEISSIYIKQALNYEPFNKDYHSVLVKSENGAAGDWYCSCNFELIKFYKEFTNKYPNYRAGHAFLFDQLIHDKRLDEASEVLNHMKSIENYVEHSFFEGDIEFEKGNLDKASEIWDKALEQFNNNWAAYFIRAERYLKLSKYEKAIEHYKKSIDYSKSPRMIDADIAIAEIAELIGDYKLAINARKHEIKILKEDYHILSGESVDKPLREIERLNSMI